MKFNWSKRSENPEDFLCGFERLAYACTQAGSNFSFMLIGGFLTFYYTNVAGLNAAIIGSIIAISKILDGFTDITVGTLVDRTKSKLGKCRPWILFTAIPHVIALILVFTVPPGMTEAHKYIYVFVTYNLVNSITYTMLNVPIFAQNALLTSNPRERAKSGIWMQVAGTTATFILNATALKLVGALGNDAHAWTMAAAIYGSIGAVFHIFSALNTRERVVTAGPQEGSIPIKLRLKAVFTNKYWWIYTTSGMFSTMAYMVLSAGLMYYCTYVLGDSLKYSTLASLNSIVSFVALILFMDVLIKKIGNVGVRWLTFASFVITPLLMILTSNWIVVIIAYSIWGFGFACLVGSQGAMMAANSDYGLKKCGFNVAGVTSSAQSFISKCSSGLGIAIMGWVLDIFGYDGTAAVQTARALTGIKVAVCAVPIIATIISALIFTQYDLFKKGYVSEGR